MSDQAAIRLEGVEKWYGKVQILRGVTAQVERGQVIVLLGPSGSGKTTLIRTINGLERIEKGRVLVDGREVRAAAPDIDLIRSRIGFVFQQFNLFPHMTVLRNLTIAPVKIRKLSREQAEHNARRLLARVGLPDKADAYPAHLSGGQQQRVAIARALAMEPEILLLDEPTSALDPEMSAEVLDVVKGLASTGITLLCVTHELGFARRVADAIWFMDGGNLVERAAPSEFFASQHGRIRQFLAQLAPLSSGSFAPPDPP
jgi:polar amino acid transport system ATP-binding protein